MVPALTPAFFFAAPGWLDSKLHRQISEAITNDYNLSPGEKSARLKEITTMDFSAIALNSPPGREKTHDYLAPAGVVNNFQYLRWGLILSLGLVAGLSLSVGAIYWLNEKAKRFKWRLPGGFLVRGKVQVGAEVSLAHFGYNFKQALAVVGLAKLLAAPAKFRPSRRKHALQAWVIALTTVFVPAHLKIQRLRITGQPQPA